MPRPGRPLAPPLPSVLVVRLRHLPEVTKSNVPVVPPVHVDPHQLRQAEAGRRSDRVAIRVRQVPVPVPEPSRGPNRRVTGRGHEKNEN